MSGFLATLTPVPGAQIEAIYVAYYGRAADGGGYLYWENDAANLIAGGMSTTQAAVNIADAFALQPKSQANYSFLASPPATLVPTDPVQIASVDVFINAVYENLFNSAADAGGLAYWQKQILTGAVSVGSAVYDIANGATGADATILTDKIDAGLYFTTTTLAANLGSSSPLTSTFAAVAVPTTSTVVDSATLDTSKANTDKFVASGGTTNPWTPPTPPPSVFTLTPGVDSGAAFTTSVAGAIFNAPLVASTSQFSQGSNVNLQTLTVGNSLIDTVGDGTLNAAFNQYAPVPSATGTEFVVPNVTLQGISTANLTVVTYAIQGFQGSAGTSSTGTGITGLTTVNDFNSLAGIQLGGVGNGLNTALTNVNITGFSGGTGALLFAEYLNPKAGAASNTINVSVAGLLGNTTSGQSDVLFFGAAGNPGTSGAPSLSYGTWALTVNSAADLQLEQNGVGAATQLTLSGDSSVALGQDDVGNWQKLTTINASASTSDVTITGWASEFGSNIGNLFLTAGATAGVGTDGGGNNPYGLFGSDVGLLDGNTALTTYDLSTGVNFLDVSSFSAANLANLKTVQGSNALTDNEIVVSDGAATTILGATFAGIKGFQVLGVTGIDGTINYANLPSSIDEILYQTDAEGGVTINNAPAATVAAPFIIDTEDNGEGEDLTVNAAAQTANIQAANITSSSLEIIIGSAFRDIGKIGDLGVITLTGEETVTISSVALDSSVGDNVIDDNLADVAISLTPGAPYLHEYLTITGTQNLDINGAIQDYSANTPGTLYYNDLVLSITDTGVVTIGGVVNAVQILAATSGGLIMEGADNNYSNYEFYNTNNGDLIIGSATGSNVLIGSIGNDQITGTLSTTKADTIATGGGADAITLAQNHTASDHIELYTGAGLLKDGSSYIVSATLDSIVDTSDHAQAGWWGVNTDGTNNYVGTDHTRIGHLAYDIGNDTGDYLYGTSADLSTVQNFVTAKDVVDISVGAFGGQIGTPYGLLENFFAEGTGGQPSDIQAPTSTATTTGHTPAVFSAPVNPGQDVQYNTAHPDASTSANVLVLSGVYNGAAAVAQTLGSPVGDTAITFLGGLTLNYIGPHNDGLDWAGHIIIAYQNQPGGTVIADLDISASQQVVYDTFAGYGLNGNASNNFNYGGFPPNETIGVSDLVQLTGVSLSNLHAANIHFVA